MQYLISAVIVLFWGILFGVLTNKVISDKGYTTNWFWWGFFFGLIALIVAITKPAYTPSYTSTAIRKHNNEQERENLNQTLMENGGWKCTCGRVNAKYVTTCPCGLNQRDLICKE